VRRADLLPGGVRNNELQKTPPLVLWSQLAADLQMAELAEVAPGALPTMPIRFWRTRKWVGASGWAAGHSETSNGVGGVILRFTPHVRPCAWLTIPDIKFS
jgi:hypothetical protein